jgi:hypothetical protein
MNRYLTLITRSLSVLLFLLTFVLTSYVLVISENHLIVNIARVIWITMIIGLLSLYIKSKSDQDYNDFKRLEE